MDHRTFVKNAEDLDIVMSMYNMLEYSDNFSMPSGSLWNYYRDEVNDSANEIDDNDNKMDNHKTATSKSFEYKTKIIRSTANKNSSLNAEFVFSLKHFLIWIHYLWNRALLDMVKILYNIWTIKNTRSR